MDPTDSGPTDTGLAEDGSAAPKPTLDAGDSVGSKLRRLGAAVLAVLLYAAVAAAAAETFLSGSGARWIVVGAVAIYAVLTVGLWRFVGWPTRAALSLFVLWVLLGVSVWQGEGQALVLAGQPTPILLSAFTLGAIVVAGLVLTLARSFPAWLRAAAGILAVYGAAAFGMGIAEGTPYPLLLHGAGFGPPLRWLQGAVLGALLVVPAAILWELFQGVTRVRGAALRGWFVRLATLAASLGVAVWTFAQPAGVDVAAVEVATQTPAAEVVEEIPAAEEPVEAPAETEELDLTPVADFALPSARDASLVNLSDYAGKVVLINWARSSCGWSQQQAPRLAQLYDEFKGQGLEVIGVLDEEGSSTEGLPAFLDGMSWPTALMDQAEFAREIGPLGSGATPETYLVTREGKLSYVGLLRGDDYWVALEAAVREAVAEEAPERSYIRRRELEPAPSFALQDMEGDTVEFSDFRGKPLVVNFFDDYTCDWAGPVLARLHEEYGPQGLQFVGVNFNGTDEEIQACAKKSGTKYPILRGDSETQHAWSGGNKAWAVFFVTADGRMFKKIYNNRNDGIEDLVFRKFAELLVAGKAVSRAAPPSPAYARLGR